jgi:hypothetical protein
VLTPEVNNFTVAIAERIFAVNFVATALAIIAYQGASRLATRFEQWPKKAQRARERKIRRPREIVAA